MAREEHESDLPSSKAAVYLISLVNARCHVCPFNSKVIGGCPRGMNPSSSEIIIGKGETEVEIT
jgi:hypothetical protein